MSAASHISSQSNVIRHSSETRSCTAFTRVAFCCFRESIITERHFSKFVSSTGEVSAEDGMGKRDGYGDECREDTAHVVWRKNIMRRHVTLWDTMWPYETHKTLGHHKTLWETMTHNETLSDIIRKQFQQIQIISSTLAAITQWSRNRGGRGHCPPPIISLHVIGYYIM